VKYRAEIDGLRALAVLPAIFFHAGFESFSGGYVGVDVFFVISGYLITTIIINEIAEGKFTIVNFYERRARRILPALFLVMLVCLPFAWFWLTPSDLINFGQSIVTVSAFSSNILFWQESGYFETASELKALIHTWSLAVEEQYYFIFPLFLVLTWRLGLKWILSLLAIGFLVSLGAAHWGAFNKPSATFFLLPTRGWELLIGIFTAFYLKHNDYLKSDHINQILSLLGFGLIVYAVVTFDDSTPHPSLYTLIPTLGTALLILTAVPKTFIQKILSYSPIVGIGLISYSLYLWHQPFLAFARHRLSGEVSDFLTIALCLFSFPLAYCSWRWVEKPFRNKKNFTRKSIFSYSLIGIIIFSAFGLYLISSNGAMDRFSKFEQKIFTNFIDPDDYVVDRFSKIQLKDFDGTKRKKVMLIGDSHAEDLTNAIYESNAIKEISLSGYYILTACGVLMVEPEVIRKHQTRYDCSKLNNFYTHPKLLELMSQADEVWVVSTWREWTILYLTESIKNIKKINDNIKIFGSKSFGEINQNEFLWKGIEVWERERELPEIEIRKNERIKEIVAPMAEYIGLHKILCESLSKCSNFDGVNIYSYDGSHLTPHGAKILGERLFIPDSDFK